MFNEAFPKEFTDLVVKSARIYLINYGHSVLGEFSKASQSYAAKMLQERGVQLELGLLVKEVANDHVVLSDGRKILTRTIIWAGGLKANPLASNCCLLQGHGGRINVHPDLTVENYPGVYIVGDIANILSRDGKFLPQLGSVAQQSGYWAAKNIIAEIEGKPKMPFQYKDKGIMAMVGRNAAVVEIGKKRREIKGWFAFIAWLGVHATLLPTFRQKIVAFIEWAWDYFGKTKVLQILDNTDAARVKWDETKK